MLILWRGSAFTSEKDEEIAEFNLKKLTKQTLRKSLKKIKGYRSSDIDFIDVNSMQLAAPLI